jgi:FkbM family methyltransferase
MKTLLVGNALGRSAVKVRSWFNLLRAIHSSLDTVGEVANECLAWKIVTQLCLPDKCFVDVGAHIGSITGEVLRTGVVKVIAIEAMVSKADMLKRKFPTVDVHQCAAGNEEVEVAFFVNKRDSGFSSLSSPVSRGTDIVETRVPMKRLDDLIAYNNIDVIKIDVEGAELGVLRGGERLIRGNRPTIMFESGVQQHSGLNYQVTDLWQWFGDREFEIVVPNRVAHNGPGLTSDGFVESHFYPRRTTNYFAIPRERRIEIRNRVRSLLGR